jgi:hypothetical protein
LLRCHCGAKREKWKAIFLEDEKVLKYGAAKTRKKEE